MPLNLELKSRQLLSEVNRTVGKLAASRVSMAAGTYGYNRFGFDSQAVNAILPIVEDMEAVLAGASGQAFATFLNERLANTGTLSQVQVLMTALADALGAFNTRIIAQIGAITTGGFIQGETLSSAQSPGGRDTVSFDQRVFTAGQTSQLRGDIDAIVAARDAFLPAD